MKKYIGKIRDAVELSIEYKRLAEEDELAAKKLTEVNSNRQAFYFILQAMEKYLRSKIFSRLNAEMAVNREMNMNHLIGDAIDLLIELINTSQDIKKQIRHQLYLQLMNIDLDEFNEQSFQNERKRFHSLHNNMRYPFYNSSRKRFSTLEIDAANVEEMFGKLNYLKRFLLDIDKL